MRRLTLLVAAMLVGTACGGGGAGDDVTTSAPEAMPTSSATATTSSATTTTRSPATTSTTTTTTTTIAQTTTTAGFDLPAVLRPDGVGPVDFGTEADEAMALLAELLGPPSDVREEEAHDLYLSVELIRIVTWNEVGLRLVFTDWGGDFTQPKAIPLHLADWEVTGPGLTTTEGLGWGTTVSDLRGMYPEVRFGINEFAPVFAVETPAGPISGGFDWPYEDFARAVIASLNEHGAGLDPDDLDAAMGRPLLDFMESQGLEDARDVLTALDLPPGDVRTGWMYAGTGPQCC